MGCAGGRHPAPGRVSTHGPFVAGRRPWTLHSSENRRTHDCPMSARAISGTEETFCLSMQDRPGNADRYVSSDLGRAATGVADKLGRVRVGPLRYRCGGAAGTLLQMDILDRSDRLPAASCAREPSVPVRHRRVRKLSIEEVDVLVELYRSGATSPYVRCRSEVVSVPSKERSGYLLEPVGNVTVLTNTMTLQPSGRCGSSRRWPLLE